MIECEVKLKIDNPEVVKQKLIELDFSECDSLTETDTYFDTKTGEIRKDDKALRVRETMNHTNGHKYCQVNFKEKKLDDKSMSRPEYESIIEDAAVMAKILECLGYFPVLPKVIKKRIELKSTSINACIDFVEGLGDYLELEAIVETEAEKEKELERIASILGKLGYSMSDTTTTSYLTALQNKM